MIVRLARSVLFVGVSSVAGLVSSNAMAQVPGDITTAATGAGALILDPNSDGKSCDPAFCAAYTDDITQSELQMITIPLATANEPLGDITPSGGTSDLVDTATGQQALMLLFDDRGTTMDTTDDVLIFRIRIGDDVTGNFGYSVLVDTDNAVGTGVDGNAVAGNPGFEAELRLQTGGAGAGVHIENIDGTVNGSGVITPYSLSVHSQRSVALTTASGDADLFYDFFIFFDDFASNFGIQSLRSHAFRCRHICKRCVGSGGIRKKISVGWMTTPLRTTTLLLAPRLPWCPLQRSRISCLAAALVPR